MKKTVTLFLFLATLSAHLWAQKPEATWIWYPGDFELWLSSKVQAQRTERGVFYPPFWRMDRHTQLIAFSKTVELSEDETLDVRVEGDFNAAIDGHFVYEENITQLSLPKGKHDIRFLVYNPVTPPAIWVKGKTVVSDKSWTVSRQNHVSVNADSWIFNTPDNKPETYRLATEPQSPASVAKENQSALIDFGKETFGYIKLHNLKGSGTVTAFYGESEEEAKAGKDAETWDVFKIAQPNPADFVSEHSKAFRYVRLTWDGTVSFDDVSMLYEYNPL